MDALAQLKTSLAGRYDLEREIGRGGMATVYLVRDVRHNRRVALKVLNPELGAVLGVERFLSEIQVTANLQHPNLLPLFDSGEADGLLFYVMPYIDGESLRAKLQREKQLPIDEAIHMASAVASALDYAHRHGVIHRDLKPENILVHDGQPLVADFGIALAVSNAGGNRITQTGLSLGTPHYMSPEQATGDREIDGRTDVYSLGAVTYEMLVGEPPHDGKTSQAIIAKVLTDKPRSIRLARETVPVHVEAAVERSLAKLPADRFHTAHEFADALVGKGVVLPGGLVTPGTTSHALPLRPARLRRLRAWAPWAVAVTALAAAGAAWGLAVRASADTSIVRYEIPLPPGFDRLAALGSPVAVSTGGRFVAFAAVAGSGRQRVYLRAASELQPREVAGSEDGIFPFFSPDGAWVGFWAGGQIKKVPVTGGSAVVVTDLPGASGSTWSPSGWIVTSVSSALAKVAANGGAAVAFTKVDSARGETGQLNPVALADGKHVLYSSNAMGGAAGARIGIASLEDGSSTVLDVQGSFPLGVLDGYLLYTTAAGTVMAVPFDIAGRRITGTPVGLVDQAAVSGINPTSYAQLSADGSLVYVSGVARRQIVLQSANGTRRSLGDPGAYSWPRFSPDGQRLAVTLGSLSRREIWVYDLTSDAFAPLPPIGTLNDRPEWTPDGKALVIRARRDGRNALWLQPIDAVSQPTLLLSLSDAQIDEGVLSPDGRYLVVQRDRNGNGEILYRDLRGDTALRLVDPVGNGAYGARFSPDGRWVVFTSTEAGPEHVYVRPFPSLSAKYRVTGSDGGGSPVWSADGKRIYYVIGAQLWVANIAATQPFTIGSRSVVLDRGYTFNAVHADYDVGRDSRSIVALQSPNLNAQLVVVRNFDAELRALRRGAPR